MRPNDLLDKYPDLLKSLARYSKLKCEGRVLRRDSERLRRLRRFRRSPGLRLKQFETAFFRAMDQKHRLFVCPVCRNVLKAPVTVECGHSFCSDCLNGSFSNCCIVCGSEVATTRRCVDVLMQDLVEKWRERNRSDIESGPVVPETMDIFGLEPRYSLRSGYAGLQINSDTEAKISRYLDDSSPRYSNERSKFCNNAIEDICTERFEATLENVFREVDDIKEEALRSTWNCITVSDLECILCSRCLLDPVTTACGHTFCRGCLTRVLDHGLSCPLCMAPLSISDYSRSTTGALQQAISFLVPEDFRERVSNNVKECSILETNSDIPVFICTNAFPGVACPLYVYEPRYRLVARRCLQSNTKRFAMAGKDSSGEKFVQYGTVLEIRDAVTLEDGRFILTTVGVRRFKVVNRSEQDGYDTAKISYIKDNVVPQDRLQDLVLLHEKVYNKAFKWIGSLKPKVLAEVERLIGRMPTVERNWHSLPDGPSWAWWLMPILPLSSQLQVGFLSANSLEKRLRAIDKMLEHMKIRMKSLQRNTSACAHDVSSLDSCSDSERPFDMPYNN